MCDASLSLSVIVIKANFQENGKSPSMLYREGEGDGGRGRKGGGREGWRERKRYNINMGEGKVQLYSST